MDDHREARFLQGVEEWTKAARHVSVNGWVLGLRQRDRAHLGCLLSKDRGESLLEEMVGCRQSFSSRSGTLDHTM